MNTPSLSSRSTIVAAIAEGLRTIAAPGSVIELRIPNVDDKKGRVDSGYFTDLDQAALAASRYDGRADGVYMTLNPAIPALLARAENRVKEWTKLATTDEYIDRRIWLPIDIDPRVGGKKRPAGISSSDSEHRAALAHATKIQDWLALQGWPEPVVADSGNGGALLYPIDLPNDAESATLIQRCLEALAIAFGDSLCDIDMSVFNAARIWKIYGTLAGKGDSTADRPHRRAAIISAPETRQNVAPDLLRALARRVLPETERDTSTSKGSSFDLEVFLSKHNLQVVTEKTHGDKTIYVLEECPFNAEHRAPDACITQATNGKLGFHCFHNSCQGNTWKTLREKLEPGVYDPKPSTNGVTPPRPNIQRTTPARPPANVDPATGEITGAHATVELLSWHEQGITLRQLQSKHFDPEVWIIENILPEGACLFAAKYKSKKSWLSLALGCAVSMGGKALGRLDVAQGRVLYLDLEGKQQRIQKRTRAMLGVSNTVWPDNFHVFTKWPQGEKGMEQLADWLRQFPDTRLVIIDVLNDFRRPMERHEQFYQYDRDTVQPINELLETHHAAGLLVHHFNKTKGNTDIFDSITGSTGLPSAVNTMWAFERDVNDSNLTKFSLRGRDIEHDDPLALSWDDYLTQHVIEGPAAEVATTGERRTILDLMSDDTPRTPKQIAAGVSKSVESVQQLLRKLLNDGLIEKPGYGTYARVVRDRSSHTDQSDQSDQSGNSDRGTINSDRSNRHRSEFIPHTAAVNADSDHSDRVNKGSVGTVAYSYEGVQHQETGIVRYAVYNDHTEAVVLWTETEAEALAWIAAQSGQKWVTTEGY
jgi:hypothetical protein